MKTKEDYLTIIAEAAESLGWSIGFKSDPITENVEYLILGNSEKVKEVIRILEAKTKPVFDA